MINASKDGSVSGSQKGHRASLAGKRMNNVQKAKMPAAVRSKAKGRMTPSLPAWKATASADKSGRVFSFGRM